MVTHYMNGGRRLVLGAIIALSGAATMLAQEPVAKLDGRLRLALVSASESKPGASLSRTSSAMQDIFLTGDASRIRSVVTRHGGTVRTVAGDVVTARVPAAAILEIARSTSVKRMHGAAPVRRFNESAARSVDAVRVWTAPPAGQTAYTGKGVIVGIIDSGIDWTHPDFRNPEDSTKTRILRIWDQTDSLGGEPHAFDYGTEWTNEQIDAALLSGNPDAVRHRDLIGHGTHVAGTAAGNGLAVGHHRGMAPEADIAVVSLNWQSSTSIVDAAAYLFELGKQLGRPVVINMSLGSVDAARDGTDPVDVALDNLVNESSGRVVCVAAGNSGGSNDHWSRTLSDETTWTYLMHDPEAWGADPANGLTIVARAVVPASAAATTRIAVGVDSLAHDDEDNITPVPTAVSEWRTIAELASQQVPVNLPLTYRNDSVAGRITMVAMSDATGQYTVYLIINDVIEEDFTLEEPLRNGADFYRVLFEGDQSVHMWAAMGLAADTSMIAGAVDEGYTAWDNAYSVSSPGTARTVLTVGASSNVAQYENYGGETVPVENAGTPGDLAAFSSVGPTSDGRVKPEIVAPGEGVVSSLASNLRQAFLEMPESPVAKGGYHAIFSGTSMACPVVAGSVALYLEKNPTAGYEQVKSAIIGAARADGQTASFGALPNTHWGHGKLDIYRAIYGATSGVDDGDGLAGVSLEACAPNPATTAAVITFSIASRQEVRLDIVDMQGVVRMTLLDGDIDAGRHEVRLDAASLVAGVYSYRLTAGRTTRSGTLTVVR